MKENIVIYKATDFNYPTKEELKSATESYPDLHNFGFEYQSEIEVLSGLNDLRTFNKKSHLYGWDLCLLNKMGKLNNAFSNCHSNFHRGIPLVNDELFEEKYINKIQFDFYSEAFYYFLFSIRDMILQIINVYYDLNLEENEVTVNRLLKEINDKNIKDLIIKLSTDFKNSKEIRDGFTHRFPVNQPDLRPSYSAKDNSIGLRAGYAKIMTSEEIMTDIIKVCCALTEFVDNLRVKMKINKPCW